MSELQRRLQWKGSYGTGVTRFSSYLFCWMLTLLVDDSICNANVINGLFIWSLSKGGAQRTRELRSRTPHPPPLRTSRLSLIHAFIMQTKPQIQRPVSPAGGHDAHTPRSIAYEVHTYELCRTVRGSGNNSRAGSGRDGPGQLFRPANVLRCLDLTRSDPRDVENPLTPSNPTRQI